MKRKFTYLVIISFLSLQSFAQVSEGGVPLLFNQLNENLQYTTPVFVTSAPDITALAAQDNASHSNLLRIGALVPASISYPSSGSFITLPDGSRVWRADLEITNAPAIGLYYDRFHLPQGVKYFVYNQNRRQVLGAYTANENPEDGIWANEKVQGDRACLELDIDADADTNAIALQINKAAVFYKSITYLSSYSDAGALARTTGGPYLPYDSSSPCEINAECSTTLTQQRKATVKIEYIEGHYIYGATGVLINNTSSDCTPYLLTASHVEPGNSTSNSTFSNWTFYFNYETPCTYSGPQPSTTQTMTGATFNARSSYDSASNKIAGDFILLKLSSAIPSSYGAYMTGWDNTGSLPTGQCISYHHPNGDVKKVSYSNTVSPLGNFNNAEPNSHWEVNWAKGGTEEGSSGSGLFDPNGRLIGDLSGGFVYLPSCVKTNHNGDTMANYAEYSKFSLNWLNTFQSPSNSTTRLKDWLDPSNSGKTTMDAISCGVASAVGIIKNKGENISVYPNPTNGIVNIAINSHINTAPEVKVYNSIGMRLPNVKITNAGVNIYTINLNGYAPGIYMLTVTAAGTQMSQRMVLIK